MADDAPLLFDVSRLIWRRWAAVRATGIDRICLAWLHHYRHQAQATIVHARGRHILSRSASAELFDLLAGEPAAGVDDRTRKQLLRLAARHVTTLVGGRGKGRLWLNVGHTGLDRPGLAGWAKRAGVRPVFMVHDLIPLTHPQFCRAGEAARHAIRMRTALQAGHGIVANSQHTLDTLAAFAADEGLAMAAASVIWPGTEQLGLHRKSDRSEPVVRSGRARFVVLGTIEGRKNHLLLLRIWQQLIARLGAATPQLVIIGRRGWACDDVLAMLDTGQFGDHVVEMGAVGDGEIGALLSDTKALLFPSLAEGYGLPLVEALEAGVPVVATDLPVFREIGQGVPLLLPADDIEAWIEAIVEFASPDSATRAAQLTRIARYRAPDWQTHFQRADEFLARL